MLALVFVDALDVDVEQRVRVQRLAGELREVFCQAALAKTLDCLPVLAKTGIIRIRLEPVQLLQAGDPASIEVPADQHVESRVDHVQEAPRAHAVGDIVELLRPQFAEVSHDGGLEQAGVQGGDAVDGKAAHGGQVGHAHHMLRPAVIDQRQARDPPAIAGETHPDLVEEAVVDLVDDLHVPGKQPAHEVHRPCLQCLRQQGMVGEGKGPARDNPGAFPCETMFIHQQAHQFRDSDRRMGIVQLDDEFFMKAVEVLAVLQVQAQHVLQGAGGKEILLPEAQLLADLGLVIGVQHLGDVFRHDVGIDGAVVVTDVERIEIERLGRLRAPQAQQVGVLDAEAGNRGVVRDPVDHQVREPRHTELPLRVRVMLGMPAEPDREAQLRPCQFPGIAVAQPEVGDFLLPAVVYLLVEDAELVADAVADGGYLQGCQRIEITGRQTPEPAVSQAGLLLLLEDLVEAHAQLLRRLPGFIEYAEVQDIVCQVRAEQVFRGQIADGPGTGLLVGLGGADPAIQQPVTHGIGCRHVVIMVGCHVPGPALKVEQVVQKGPLQCPGRHSGACMLVIIDRPGRFT